MHLNLTKCENMLQQLAVADNILDPCCHLVAEKGVRLNNAYILRNIPLTFCFPLPPGSRLACYQQAGRGWVRLSRNGKYVGVSGKRIRYFTPAPEKVSWSLPNGRESEQ